MPNAPIVGYVTSETHDYTDEDAARALDNVTRGRDMTVGDLGARIRLLTSGWSSGAGPGIPSWAFTRRGMVIGTLDGRIVRVPYRVITKLHAGTYQLSLDGEAA